MLPSGDYSIVPFDLMKKRLIVWRNLYYKYSQSFYVIDALTREMTYHN